MNVILCSTHRRAMFEFGRFIYRNEPFVVNTNRRLLTVRLTNGCEYQFMSEQNIDAIAKENTNGRL